MKAGIKIIILFLIIGVQQLYAYVPKEIVTPISPNATSLGEYGEVPVSPYTGLPLIQIPLHEISLSGHKIPISLSYHAGGVRPDQHPGWVGLGWSLNAGGCISRVVKDLPDEFYNAIINAMSGIDSGSGYYYQRNKLNIDWNNKSVLYNLVNENSRNNNYLYDTEPDQFSFSFLDYQGGFYLNPNGEWQVRCNKPINVIFNGNDDDFTMAYGEQSDFFNPYGTYYSSQGRSHSFKKFTIIGEDGTQYIFGDRDEAIEFSVLFFDQRNSSQWANTWYLTKIIYPEQREVEFNYTRGNFIAQINVSSYMMDYSATTNGWLFGGDCARNEGKYSYYDGSLIMPSYLSSILCDDVHVLFSTTLTQELEYDFLNKICRNKGLGAESMPILQHNDVNNPNFTPLDYPSCLERLKWWQLDRMSISKGNQLLRSYKFNYSNDINQRLTLQSVVLDKYMADSIYAYSFEYYAPELLPEYVNQTNDHWGFYNATQQSINANNLGSYYQQREPNPQVALYGTLSKITYPTGGYTKFVYESHNYKKRVTLSRNNCETLSNNKIAGGIRIKEIINSPSGLDKDAYIEKQYYYVSDFLQNRLNATVSSGVLLNPVQYNYTDYRVPILNESGGAIINAFSSLSVLPFTVNTCGTHIGYSEVVEEYSDGSFIIYKYSNADNGYLDDLADVSVQGHTSYEPYSSKDQERGLLLSKSEYNSQGIITNKTTFQYEKNDNSVNNFVGALFLNIVGICNSNYYTEATAYRNYTYSMRPKKQIETIYEGVDSLRKETSYTYNNIGLVETITTTQSDSNKQRVTLKYPNSYSGTYYEQMVENNRISPVVEKVIETINGYTYTTEFKQNNKYESNPVKPSSTYYAYGNDAYRLVSSYKYDQYYNLVESNPINAPITSYLWGYKGLYPVAEIKGLSHNVVSEKLNNSNFTMTDTPDTTALSNLRASLTTGTMTTYYYNAFGKISKIINPNGRCTTYHYDILGRLVAIKDEDGNYIEVYNYNYAH